MLAFRKHPTFKLFLFITCFMIAAYFTHNAFYHIVTIITHEGRGLLTQLPIVVIYFMPLLMLIMYYLHEETYNVSVKWNIKLVGVSLVGTLTLLSLILHVIFVSLGKFTFYAASPLYPVDVIINGMLILLIIVFVLIKLIDSKDTRNVPLTSTYHVSAARKVGFISLLCFANYFFGDFYMIFYLFEYFDPNILGILPFLASLLLPTFALVMAGLHRFNKAKPITLIIISTAVLVLLVATSVISYVVNPLIISQSISNFYPLGFCIKTPAGAFIVLVTFLVPYIYTVVKFILKNKIK